MVMPSRSMASSALRRPRTLGTSVTHTRTRSSERSAAARAYSSSPARGVDHHVGELAGQDVDDVADGGGRDLVGLGREVGADQGVEAGGVRLEEHLEGGAVELVPRPGRRRPWSTAGRGRGRWPRRRTGGRGRRWPPARAPAAASRVARLVATVVLPAPPLGDITVMTRPRGRSSLRAPVPLPAWRRAAAAPARVRAWRDLVVVGARRR